MGFPSIIGRAVILYIWYMVVIFGLVEHHSEDLITEGSRRYAQPSHVLCFRWNPFLNSQQLKPFFVTHRETTGLPRARQQPSMQPSHHPWKIGRATLVVCGKCIFFCQ